MAGPAPLPSAVDPTAVLKAAQAVLGTYVGEKTARDWISDMLRKLHLGVAEDISGADFEKVLAGVVPGLAVIVGPAKAAALIDEVRARFVPTGA
jgi:hypothetical protein